MSLDLFIPLLIFCHLTDRPASGESLVPFSSFSLQSYQEEQADSLSVKVNKKSCGNSLRRMRVKKDLGTSIQSSLSLSSIIDSKRFQEGLNRHCILCLLRLLSWSKTLVSQEMPMTEKNFYHILLWELLSLLCSSNLLSQMNPLLKKPQLRSGHTSIPDRERWWCRGWKRTAIMKESPTTISTDPEA